MYITCLDLEGVLVPEIWIAFAKESGIPELKRTTRDEPDYDKLMNGDSEYLRSMDSDLRKYRIRSLKSIRCRVPGNFWMNFVQ